jgi:hypothetical protein
MARGYIANEGRRATIGTINKRYGPVNAEARENAISNAIGSLNIREKKPDGPRPQIDTGDDYKAFFQGEADQAAERFSKEQIVSALRQEADSIILIENLTEEERKNFSPYNPDRIARNVYGASNIVEDATMPESQKKEWLSVISNDGASIANAIVKNERGNRASVDSIISETFNKLVSSGYQPNEAFFLTRNAVRHADSLIGIAKYGPPEETGKKKFSYVSAKDGKDYYYDRGETKESKVRINEGSSYGVKPFYS